MIANRLESLAEVHVPVHKRTKEWLASVAAYYIQMSGATGNPDSNLISLYNTYNGERNEADFEYLTKEYGFESAAQLRHVPLVKPLLDILIGDWLERPIDYIVNSIDEKSLDAKLEQSKEVYLQKLLKIVSDRISVIEKEISSGKSPEQAYKEAQIDLNTRQLEDLIKQARSDVRLTIEKAADNVLKFLLAVNRFKETRTAIFRDYLICKTCVVYINAELSGRHPQITRVHPANVFPDRLSSELALEKRNWVVVKYMMSYQEILLKYGHLMSNQEKEMIKKGIINDLDEPLYSYETEDRVVVSNHPYNNDSLTSSKITTGSSERGLEVYHVQFKVNTAAHLAKVKLKNSTDHYIAKLSNNDATLGNPENIESVETRFYQVLYSVIRIGNSIYLTETESGMARWQARDAVDLAKVDLHYAGILRDKDKSLIERTKDIQDKYDIFHFLEEKTIANAGSKGVVVPVNLLPDGMELPEALYNAKNNGILPIDSSKMKETQNMGGFTTYDMTLSASAALFRQVIVALEDTASKITGVPRQRTGDISTRDLVGNTNTALAQSMKATESIMETMDNTLERIVTLLLNAGACAYKGQGKKAIEYVNELRESEYFEITEELGAAQYGVVISNGGQEREKLRALQSLLPEMVKHGTITAEILVHALDCNNFRDLKNKVITEVEKVKAMQAQNAQAQQQAVAEQQKQDAALKKLEIETKKYGIDITARTKTTEIEKDYEIASRETDLAEREIQLNASNVKEQLLAGERNAVRKDLDGKKSPANDK